MRWEEETSATQTQPIFKVDNRKGIPRHVFPVGKRHTAHVTGTDPLKVNMADIMEAAVGMSTCPQNREVTGPQLPGAGSTHWTPDHTWHRPPGGAGGPGPHLPASLGASHTWEHGGSICGSEGLNSQMGAKKAGSRSPSYLLTQKISSALPNGGTPITPPPCQTQVTSWGPLSPGGPGMSPALGRVRVH